MSMSAQNSANGSQTLSECVTFKAEVDQILRTRKTGLAGVRAGVCIFSVWYSVNLCAASVVV